MIIGAPASLASYAYQLAGGGIQGVLAALASTQTTGTQAADLLASAGAVSGTDGLAAAAGGTLETGAFGLEASAGQGDQALQTLLNPPAGYGNPLLGPQSVINPDLAGAFAAYQYAQAQGTGQGGAYTQFTLAAAQGSAQAGLTGLFAPEAPASALAKAESSAAANPIDANQDGVVSAAESLAYALRHPALSPLDRDANGFVSPSEQLAYGLQHAYLDPADTNFDGIVSPAEALAYALKHPTLAQPGAAGVDVFA